MDRNDESSPKQMLVSGSEHRDNFTYSWHYSEFHGRETRSSAMNTWSCLCVHSALPVPQVLSTVFCWETPQFFNSCTSGSEEIRNQGGWKWTVWLPPIQSKPPNLKRAPPILGWWRFSLSWTTHQCPRLRKTCAFWKARPSWKSGSSWLMCSICLKHVNFGCINTLSLPRWVGTSPHLISPPPSWRHCSPFQQSFWRTGRVFHVLRTPQSCFWGSLDKQVCKSQILLPFGNKCRLFAWTSSRTPLIPDAENCTMHTFSGKAPGQRSSHQPLSMLVPPRS